MQRARIGDVEVLSMLDFTFNMKPENVYPGAVDQMDAYRHYLGPRGEILMPCNSFLLRADGRTVLVDTGMGPESDGQLMTELSEAGVRPDEVDQVIFTHLHGDHTGWNLDRQTGQPLFPRARYLVPRGDWDHYRSQEPAARSFARDVAPLEALGCMDLVEGDHTLSPSLVTMHTPGHTPGHLSILVDSGGERGCILGDVVLTPMDVEQPEWANTFDSDDAIALATRRSALDRFEAEQALIGAAHLPAPGFGRFVRVEGRHAWRAGVD